MTTKGLSRRQTLIAAGARCARNRSRPAQHAAADAVTLRQGYQTNMWGMPTYYLLHSGLAEKHGLKFEEFAVPSGNLTMQQKVARQVDLGTYAGPSFALGHEKGGMIAHRGDRGRRQDCTRDGAQRPRHHQSRRTCAARRSPTRPARQSATSSSTRSCPRPG